MQRRAPASALTGDCSVLHTHLILDSVFIYQNSTLTNPNTLLVSIHNKGLLQPHTHGCCDQPAHISLMHLSSFVSWCCSDNLTPPGLAWFALFLFHLPLLCLDRTTWCCCRLPEFGIFCDTTGQKDSLDQRRPSAARERSASCPPPTAALLGTHSWMHSRSGRRFPCTHIQTVN